MSQLDNFDGFIIDSAILQQQQYATNVRIILQHIVENIIEDKHIVLVDIRKSNCIVKPDSVRAV
jgi:hypothetical protein